MRLIKAAVAMFAAAALVIAPAAQADDAEIPNPESPIKVSNIKVTNKQAHAWQLVDLTADWSVDDPQSGQTMTITLGDGLRWGARTGFDLKLKDTDIAVGSCTAVAGGTTLTCTLNDEAAKWDTLTGTLEAASQISDQLIGQTGSEITVNGTTVAVVFGDTDGDGVCDVDCGGLLPEQASKSIFKSGWLSSRGEDGTYNWTWNVNVSGATQYTVVDPGATFSSVYCTNSDWSNGWRVDPTVTDDTVAWTVDSTDTVCRARFTTTSTTASATNAATVNGQEYSHTAWMNAWGRGDADGSMNPTPTPTVPPCPPAPTDNPTDVPTDT
ncbi:Ig-like domain-containing protein, partial [Actinomyces oricola]